MMRPAEQMRRHREQHLTKVTTRTRDQDFLAPDMHLHIPLPIRPCEDETVIYVQIINHNSCKVNQKNSKKETLHAIQICTFRYNR